MPSAACISASVSDFSTGSVLVSLGDVAPPWSNESSEEEDPELRLNDDRALSVRSKESCEEEDPELRLSDDRALSVRSKESSEEEDPELRLDDDRALPVAAPEARARSSACV
jgi:hypothetical protein